MEKVHRVEENMKENIINKNQKKVTMIQQQYQRKLGKIMTNH